MKNRLHILLLTVSVFLLSSESIFGQNADQLKKSKNYITWVSPNDNSSKIKGFLTEIGDSLIVISDLSNHESHSIYIHTVEKIKFRKKGRVGRGVLIGALSGAALGSIIAFDEGDDWFFSAETKALLYGAPLSITGALIGGLIGSIKITIPINGNAKNQREKLLKYKRSY